MKSKHDEIDMISIDQLHRAVLQMSKNCFEIKKLCVTVLISSSTLIAVFTEDRLDVFLFVSALFLVTFFWLLDSHSYYYQDKLRARMKVLAEEIASRNEPKLIIDGIGMPFSEERENRIPSKRVIFSLFNSSMFFYLALIICILILTYMFHTGIIQNVITPK